MSPQNYTEWDVELAISGPIALRVSHVVLEALKGELSPFTTRISLHNVPFGVTANVITRAFEEQGAMDAAIYFVGTALDVLTLHLDLPLSVSIGEERSYRSKSYIKRRVPKVEWERAFHLGRQYAMERPYLSRAISWYRKGLISNDPIDKLIAFWSALEAVGSPCRRVAQRTNKGSVNQIMDCFDQVWGSCEQWRVIPNKPKVIDQFQEFRNGIAHGFLRVDVETFNKLAIQLPTYKAITREFLLSWEQGGTSREGEVVWKERQEHQVAE